MRYRCTVRSFSYYRAQTEDQIPVYNYVSSEQKPLTWDQFMDMTSRYGMEVPSMRSMWYYSLTLNKHRPVHLLYLLFLHFIPAAIVDGAALLLGRQPKYVVLKLATTTTTTIMMMMMMMIELIIRAHFASICQHFYSQNSLIISTWSAVHFLYINTSIRLLVFLFYNITLCDYEGLELQWPCI